MVFASISNFTASDLKQPGPILDAAAQGVVRIKRRGEAFLLLRESQFETLMAEAADSRPKTLADLLVDYNAEEVKARLSSWLADAPVGKELL
jgi:hypothetical protein